jgi:hypothetical protein
MEFHPLWKDADPDIPISFIVGTLSRRPLSVEPHPHGLRASQAKNVSPSASAGGIGVIPDRNLDRMHISETRYQTSA